MAIFSQQINQKIDSGVTFLGKYLKTDLKYTLSNGFWVTSNTIIGSLISFGVSVAFAHFVSKEVFGMYKYIISIVGISLAFTLTGMNTVVTRSAAQGNDAVFRKSLFAQTKWIWLQVLILLVAAAYYFMQDHITYGVALLFSALLAPISTISNTYNSFLVGKAYFRQSALYGVCSSIFTAVVTLLVIYFSPNLIGLVICFYATAAFINTFFLVRTFKTVEQNSIDDPQSLTYGKHLSVMNFFGIISMHIDNLLVYYLLGPIQLAIYTFATILPEKIKSLLGFIQTIALPRMSKYGISTKSINHKVVLLILLSILSILVYFIFAPILFKIFLPEYESSVFYSQIYSISIITIVGTFLSTILISEGEQNNLYIVNIAGPIIRIIILFAFIYEWGVWGAVFARIVSQSISSYLTYYILMRKKVT